MAPSSLIKRSGHFYLRLTIPLDLRSRFDGRRELRKSLRTTRYNNAKALLRGHLYRAEKLFAAIRSGLMDEAQIKKLVSDFLKQTLDESLERRIESPSLSPEEREEQLYLHETWLHEAGEDLAEGRHLKLASLAKSVLEVAGVSLSEEPLEFKRLCHELLRGIYEVVEPTEIERLKGNYGSEHEARLQAAPAEASGREARGRDEGDGGPPLSKLVQEFIRESAAANKWRDRSKREAEGCVNLFLRIVGEGRRIGALTRRDLAEFRDILTRWPSKANKRYRGKGGSLLSVQDMLARAEPPFLSVTTINNHLGYCSQLWAWAVANGYTDRNIAEGLIIRRKSGDGEEDGGRKAFSREDMMRMLKSPLYSSPPSKKYPHRWWIPLLLMTEGLRLNEAAGLTVDDIKEVSGVQLSDINAAGNVGKTLKSRAAARRVPLHGILEELGFLDFVEEVRASGQKRLFPALKLKRGTFAQDFSRWWGRYVRANVTADRKKVAAHSLRHSWINAGKQGMVKEAVSPLPMAFFSVEESLSSGAEPYCLRSTERVFDPNFCRLARVGGEP